MASVLLLLALALTWVSLSGAQPAQLINGNRTHAGATNYGITTGTGSAYILTLNAAIPGYVNGSCYLMQAHTANTGAASLNVNGRGARVLKKKVGAVLVDLEANDIIAGQLVEACTDGTVMQTDLGAPPGSTGGFVDVSGTPSGGELAVFVDANTVQGLTTLTATITDLDASTATRTRPHKTGTIPPATCAVGDTFFDTDAAAGQNIYGCTAVNTWTLEGGTSGGDVTSVGNCTTGACLDGTSTGGTNLAFYDGNSNRGTLETANLTADRTYTLPDETGLLATQTYVAAQDVAERTTAADLELKRLVPRQIELTPAVGTVSPPPSCDTAGADFFYRYLITGPLTIPPPSGTCKPFQLVRFVFQSDSPQTLVFQTGAGGFSAGANLPLPTATTGDVAGENRYDHFTFVYNAAANRLIYIGGSAATGPCSLAAGCTGSALADPGAHRLLGWDETDNAVKFQVLGPEFTYTAATDTWTLVDASPTVAGKVRLATTPETTTGTSTAQAVTPAGLAGSTFGKRYISLECIADATALTTGTGKCFFPIHPDFNGWNVVGSSAHVGAVAAATSGVNVDIHRCGAVATGIRCSGTNVSVFSTVMTIDVNEDGTETGTAGTINPANQALATGEWLRVDVAGTFTAAQGLYVTIVIQKP